MRDLEETKRTIEAIKSHSTAVDIVLTGIEKAAERLKKLGLEKSHAVLVAAEMFEVHLEQPWFTEESRTGPARPRAVA